MAKEKPKDAPPPDPVAEVSAMVAEAAGEDPRAMVYLTRKDPKDGKEKHLARYTPDMFDVDLIREEWGGGDYRARIKDHAGLWRAGSVGFSVEGEPTQKPREVAAVLAPAASSAPPPWLASLLATLGPVLVELVRNRPAAPDPAAMVKAQAESMRTVVELLGLRKEMEPKGEFDRFYDAFKMGMSVAQDRSEGDSGMGAVAAAVGKLADLAARSRSPDVPPVAGELPPVAPPQQVTPGPMHPIQAAVQLLLPIAESGSDRAEAWADIATEQIPGLELALVEAVAQAGSVAALLDATPDPRINRHRSFFARVIDFICRPEPDDVDEPDVDRQNRAQLAELDARDENERDE